MNKENVKKWIEGLRSNNYRQIVGNLYDGLFDKDVHCACAFGVACKIAADEGHIQHTVEESGKHTFDGEYAEPPLALIEWIGVKDQFFPLDLNNLPTAKSAIEDHRIQPVRTNEKFDIVELNDEYNLDFDLIADVLEEWMNHDN